MTDQLPTGWKLDRPQATQDEPAGTAFAAPTLPSGWQLDRPGATPAVANADPSGDGDFMRGLKRTLPELKQLGAGAVAAVGDLTGWDGARDWGLETYRAQEEKLAPLSRPTDSFTGAWEEAKKGNVGALVDFGQNAAGYVAGQALESLTAAGAGALAGSEVPVLGNIAGAVGGLAAKGLVKKVVKEQAEKLIAEQVAKGATREAAEKVGKDFVASQVGKTARDVLSEKAVRRIGGAAIGTQALNTTMSLGSIYPEAYAAAEEQGRELTAGEKTKAVGAALAAAGLESVADMFNLGVLFRGTKEVGEAVAGGGIKEAAKRYAGRAAVAGAEGAVREGSTEAAQTFLERFGASKTLGDADAWREYIDSAAVGAVGGALFGGAAALHPQQQSKPLGEDEADSLRADFLQAQASGDEAAADTAHAALVNHLQANGRLIAPPGAVTVDPQGVATTAAQADAQARADVASAQRRAGLGLTPDVNAARASHPGAASNLPMPAVAPAPLGLPAPGATAIAPDGTATLPADQPRENATSTFNLSRPSLGLTQDVREAQVRHPGFAVPYPGAAPGTLASAANRLVQESSAPRPVIEGTATRVGEPAQAAAQALAPVERAATDPASIVDYLVRQGVAGGRPPAVSQIVKAYGLQPEEARALRKQAITQLEQMGPQGVKGSGELFNANSPATETGDLINSSNPAPTDLARDRTEPTAVPAPAVASAPQVAHDGSDIDVDETVRGLEVDRADRDALREALAKGVDPVHGKPIASEGFRQQYEAELANLDIAVDEAESFLRSQGIDTSAPTALQSAANEAATSPTNDRPEPTEAQKEAGNYKKGHARVAGFDVTIENPAGTSRRPEWPALSNHYGYFKGTVGKDKDHVDVFLTDRAEDASLPVFVVDQIDPKTGKFDEHKVIMGAADEAEARATYAANYAPDWNGLGAITAMPQDAFKAWLRDPKKTKRPAGKLAKPAKDVPRVGQDAYRKDDRVRIKSGSYKGQLGTVLSVGGRSLFNVRPDSGGVGIIHANDLQLVDGTADEAATPASTPAQQQSEPGVERMAERGDAEGSARSVSEFVDDIIALVQAKKPGRVEFPATFGHVTEVEDARRVVKGAFEQAGHTNRGGRFGARYLIEGGEIQISNSANALWADVSIDGVKPERTSNPETSTPADAVPKKPGARKAKQPAQDADRVARAATPEPPSSAVAALDADITALHDGKLGLADYKSAFQHAIDREADIVAELGKLTKKALLEKGGRYFAARYRNDDKARIVKALYDSMLDAFNPGESLTFVIGAGGHELSKRAALRAVVDQQTDESLAAYAERIRGARAQRAEGRAEAEKAVADPKTYDDFVLYMRAKMAEGMDAVTARMSLSPEQRAAYDDLAAAKSRSERAAAGTERRTEVRAAGQVVDGTIVETKHTKKGHDLFVVRLAERVSREDYDTLNAGAKRLGGSYSSYRGNGAVPGFQFRDRATAEAFLQLAGGDRTAAQDVATARRDAFEDDRSQSAVERLREMADRLAERATESLGRDRKANTDRRARMAASAEAAAHADQALASTMRNIASAIESGDAKFLDRVRQKTQIELLQGILRTARDQELRTRYKSYVDQERHKDDPPTGETADHATWPTYTAFRSDLATLGRQLLAIDGAKLLGQRILKVADDVTKEYQTFAKANLQKVSTFATVDGKPAVFSSKEQAERSIERSGYRGRAIPFSVKRGEHIIIQSPAEAMKRGIWQGDHDKRIVLAPEFAAELVAKVGRFNRRTSRVELPWQLETAHERRNALRRLGIETPAELRAALREFIGLREAPAAPDRVKELERSMVGRTKDGLDFFPTPEAVADEMVATAGIEDGMAVLEPSAGWGHIAERIRESGAEPAVIELSGSRRELLEAKGFNVVGTDFLEHSGQYDRIVMNPPFSDRRDAQHVQHAYSLLKPGGRLVAIMGEGVFFGSDQKAAAFRDWLDGLGGTSEKLPEGTFLDPALPVNTSTNARMVVVDKPGAATGDDSVRLRRLSGGQPAEAFDVDAAVVDITSSWKNAPKVEVVATAADLPQELVAEFRRYRSNGTDVRGVYHGRTGTIYVIRANARTRRDVEATLFHEAYGHHGLRLVFGSDTDRQIQRLLNAVGGVAGLKAYARRNDIDLAPYDSILSRPNLSREQQAGILFDELFAHMAERVNTLPNNLAQKIREFIGAIRAWLRSNGFPGLAGDLGDGELAHLLRRAQRAVHGDAQALAPELRGTRFAKDEAPGPFYSALAESVANGQGAPRAADATQWKQWLDGAQRRGEFKAEERAWLGVDRFLDEQGRAGPITRSSLADFVQAHAVEVRDVVLGGDSHDVDAAFERLEADGFTVVSDEDRAWVTGPDGDELDASSLSARQQADLRMVQQALTADPQVEFGSAQYGKYQLPGGQNYRELLLTLPPQGPTAEDIMARDGALTADNVGDVAPVFTSSHFTEPNILAHVRFNERTDADGRRVLFLEEVQSDWHQQGRKSGYLSEGIPKDAKLKAAPWTNGQSWNYEVTTDTGAFVANVTPSDVLGPDESFRPITEAEAVAVARRRLREMPGLTSNADRVPDAPFRTSWPMLAFKRMVRWAAENGFDRVAWTTGEQQADRYELSKHVARLDLTQTGGGEGIPPETPFTSGTLSAYDRNGRGLIANKSVWSPQDLAEIVGPEVAARLMAQPAAGVRAAGLGARRRTLDGLDLRIGGDGMRGFYDKVLPTEVNRWAKKFGGRVGKVTFRGADLDSRFHGPETITHGLDITPAMREAALGGLPLFRRAGDINSAAFKHWFGDSKVIDAAGAPQIVYHGTGEEFWAFEDRAGEATQQAATPLGFFFTGIREAAQYYAENASQGVPADERIVDAYLAIERPYEMTLDELREIGDVFEAREIRKWLEGQGYDGIHVDESDMWIAFKPAQIKSASENVGTFDPSSNDIRFSLGAPPEPVQLSVEDLPTPGSATLRSAVREVVRALHADKTVTTADGDDVMIPWQGLKKASENANKRAMAALMKIDELLEASRHTSTTADAKGRPNILAVHEYIADATLDGEPVQVRMIVREAYDGRRFYDHAVVEKGEPAGIPGESGPKARSSAQPAAGSEANVRPTDDNSNPDEDIRFSIRTPAQPAAADVRIPGEIHLSRGAFRSVKEWLGALSKGKVTDLRPAMLASVPLNHLVDFAAKGMHAVGQYVDMQYQMQAFRNTLYRDYDQLAQDWLKFGTQGMGVGGLLGRKINPQGRDLADLMHDTTVASVDPTRGESDYSKDPEKLRLYRELRARYLSLTEEGQRLYRDVRDAYTKQVRMLEQTLEDNLRRAMEINRARADREYMATLERIDESGDTDAEKAQARAVAADKHERALKASNQSMAAKIIGLRQKFEGMRLEAPYFPLKRFGQYFVVVKQNGQMAGFSKFESAAEQTAFADQMRAQGYEVRVGLEADKDAVRDSIDPRFVAEIEQILSGADMPEFVKDEVWQAYLERLPDMSLRKSFIHRKKVAGYHPDALRAFSSTMFHGSYQLARLKYGMELGEALDIAEEQAKRNAPVQGMQLVNELRKRHEFILNPKGGAAAQIATTAAFVYHLGANPAHLFLNATQTAMIGVPVLGSRYGFGRTVSALQRAVADFAQGKGHIERAKLSTDEKAAMADFMDAGLIDKTQAHDLAGVGETGVEYSAVRQRVMNKLGWFFHQSERFNREVTSLAAYRLARQNGDTHAAAVQRAMRDTYTIHFDYSAAARARWMQNDTAKVLLVFRNYNVNMLYRLFRDIHQSLRGESPQIRREARKQLGAMMGMYGLFAGAMGVPFYGLAMAFAGLFEDEDDPLTAEQQFMQGAVELLGPDVARVLLRGVPGAVFDVDLSDRIGMPNLWFRSPDRELEGRDAYYYWMEQLLGATPGVAKNVFDGLSLVNEGKIERGVEKMLPAFLRSPLRAIRFAQEGATTLEGQPIAEVGPGGVVAQALGYTPLDLVEQYDRNSTLKGADARLERRRRRLIDRYFLAVQNGDDEAMAAAGVDIAAFNGANPAYAITRATLRRSERLRERNRLMNQNGIVMTRRMQALQEEVEGAD